MGKLVKGLNQNCIKINCQYFLIFKVLNGTTLSIFLQRQYVKQNSCPIVAQLGLCSSSPVSSIRTLRSIHTSSKKELFIYEYSHKMVRLFKKKLHLLRESFYRREPQKYNQGMVMTNRAGCFSLLNFLVRFTHMQTGRGQQRHILPLE